MFQIGDFVKLSIFDEYTEEENGFGIIVEGGIKYPLAPKCNRVAVIWLKRPKGALSIGSYTTDASTYFEDQLTKVS